MLFTDHVFPQTAGHKSFINEIIFLVPIVYLTFNIVTSGFDIDGGEVRIRLIWWIPGPGPDFIMRGVIQISRVLCIINEDAKYFYYGKLNFWDKK